MDCPKCGHTQTNPVTCEACGVYFAKLTQSAPGPRVVAVHDEAPRGFGLGALVLVAAATGGVVFYFMRQTHAEHAAAVIAMSAPVPTAPVVQPPPEASPSPPNLAPATPPAGSEISAVEAARNATVFIRTGWGFGSGFIIDAQCHVVTNRHVVETDATRVMADHSQDIQTAMAANKQQLQNDLFAAQLHRRVLSGQAGNNLELMELDDRIRQLQQQIVDLPKAADADVATRVNAADHSGFSVTLLDGTHYDGLHANLSATADVAVFQLPATDCPFIAAERNANLRISQRVYTIGNPAGLTYTVTSGVVSGRREIEGVSYVQTDAPINPGNSGGPLITDQGRVIGINSRVMRGTQGIGFALPIDVVFSEFPDLLR
jgi:serine protease Do